MEAREREVVVGNFPYDMAAKYELAVGVEIVANAFGEGARVEGWAAVLRDLRHGMALAAQVGKLVLMFDDIGVLDESAAKAAEAAFAALSEDERTITFEDVTRAYEEEAEEAEREAAFFEGLAEFIAAQEQSPGEDITLGEAVERRDAGAEEVRKIVEGGEEGDA